MKLRKLAATALGIALALGFSACAGEGAGSGATDPSVTSAPAGEGEEVIVGVSMPSKTMQRWIDDGDAVQSQLEAKGYKVDLQFANDDGPTQANQIDSMITNGADVLIIAAIDGSGLTSQLEQAAAAGIKVIAYDRLLLETPNVDFYVTFDNEKVGAAQARALLQGMGLADESGAKLPNAPAGPFDIELFAGSADDNNATTVFNGGMAVLKPFIDDGTLVVKSGETEFAQVAIMGWSQEGGQKRMENLLTSAYGGNGAGLKGVLSPNDTIGRGIITALQGVGLGPTLADGMPIVTGQDAEIATVKLVNDDVQYSTIFKDTRELANEAVTATVAFVEGKTPQSSGSYNNGVKDVPSALLDVIVIKKDNVKSVLIDSGYYTPAEVDAGVVS
jgi:putative multiple sugar transport system substrate-binding protein